MKFPRTSPITKWEESYSEKEQHKVSIDHAIQRQESYGSSIFFSPDKHDPTVLRNFDNCWWGGKNTGLFYKDTDFALNYFEDNERSLPLNAVGIQQLASSPPKVIIPFQLFIDGTLVARNSVEPISICPGIFNRSVRNLAMSWFIMGYIEPETI